MTLYYLLSLLGYHTAPVPSGSLVAQEGVGKFPLPFFDLCDGKNYA
jgi:hypothetical protein